MASKSETGGSLTFLDLFCGCGGFTLGLLRAGMDCIAAIDFDPHAVSVLKDNLVDGTHTKLRKPLYVLNEDLTTFDPSDLAALSERRSVDLIVGGPPCQGFSTARQVDGANHGNRLKLDPRRDLYRFFLKYVDYFQPKVFVMENVLGFRSAAGGQYFTRVQSEARELGKKSGRPGYRVQAQIEDAWNLGVPQKRRRQLIIGLRNDLPGYFPTELPPAGHAIPRVPLGPAICDLPRLRAGSGEHLSSYDIKARERSVKRFGDVATQYLNEVLEVGRCESLLNHVARPHSERDLRDFARLHEGESSATAMRERNVEFEFPYDKSSFKDRYTRQGRNAPCSTIVAHLAKDGLMFIHPTQNRTLTPREAARVQSFPDWYRFPEARTHAFRLIGNAVPPLISQAVGLEVTKFLTKTLPTLQELSQSGQSRLSLVPSSAEEAAAVLASFSDADREFCRHASKRVVMAAWSAFAYLFPGLHPDNALDHGEELTPWPECEQYFPNLSPERRYCYMRSGWPVAFVELAKEVWRREGLGEISDSELYRVDAQKAGLSVHIKKLRRRPYLSSAE